MLELINKYKILLILLLIVGINIGIINYCNNQKEEAFLVLDNISQEGTVPSTSPLVKEESVKDVPVYLCGQVQMPGVYYVKSTALLQECVQLAGGFLEEADQTAVNLARVIIPNEKIYIPKIGEKIDKSLDSYENSNETSNGTKLISINQGDKETLKLLPGIGDVKAQQIIDYRTANGPFQTKEALKEVTGIGEKTYTQIEQMITTE